MTVTPDPDRSVALLAFARDLPHLTPKEREQRLLEVFDGDEEAVAEFIDRLSGRGQE